MRSEEFRRKNPVPFRLSGYEPRLSIERLHSETEIERLFGHIQESWQHLGETDPHWSVLTLDEFRAANIDTSREKFYTTGRNDFLKIIHTLERNGIDRKRLHSCLEYGCGLGRITRWLAGEFATVLGFDISAAHLAATEEYLTQKEVRNVSLHHVRQFADIQALPQADLIYSVIVLQHNPPPLIEVILAQLLACLKPGGVAIFQVPTYRHGYSFSLERYISQMPRPKAMEIHVLPQQAVFELVASANARVLEVHEDISLGTMFDGISNTFLVQKI